MVADRKRVVTVRFSDSEITDLNREKDRWGFNNVSDFVRAGVLEKVGADTISNIAGSNLIEYNAVKDCFVWKIKTDAGNEKIVMENISIEFIQNLNQKIAFELNKRKEMLNKKHKRSVAIPKGLVRG